MRKSTVILCFVFILAVAVMFSCGGKKANHAGVSPTGDDDTTLDDDENGCPDVAGDWVAEKSCAPELLSTDVGILQTICLLTVATMDGPWSGEVSDGGVVTMTGPTDANGTLNCSGPFDPTTNTISMTCGDNCQFVIVGR